MEKVKNFSVWCLGIIERSAFDDNHKFSKYWK